MPPSVQFEPGGVAAPNARPGPETIDLAGDARPRCTLELAEVRQPGLWTIACGCGLTAAVVALGGPGDARRVLLRCWERPALLNREKMTLG